MSEGVIIALIGLAGSAVGSLCGVVVSSSLTRYRIEQLEKQVAKHNSVVERTYKLEERATVQEEETKVFNRRIAELERKMEKHHG